MTSLNKAPLLVFVLVFISSCQVKDSKPLTRKNTASQETTNTPSPQQIGDRTSSQQTGNKKVYTFDNGVKVYDYQLFPSQKSRYVKVNLHEPTEEKHFLECIKQANKNDVFIDIGGSNGYYCFLAKKVRPDLEVHVLNPSPLHRMWMEDNKKLNNVHDIIVHSEAASNKDGEDFFLGRGYGDGITKKVRVDRDRVKTITIDTLVKKTNKPVHLILMDIQGGETSALLGATEAMKTVKNFFIGTHGDRHRECLHILESNGYQIKFNKTAEEMPIQPDGLIWATKKIDGRPKKI